MCRRNRQDLAWILLLLPVIIWAIILALFTAGIGIGLGIGIGDKIIK